jgi:predicted CXXCH cytochrome family protein
MPAAAPKNIFPALASAVAAALLFLTACSKENSDPTPKSSTQSESPPLSTLNPQLSTPSPTLPHLGTQGYIGSQSCVECHKDEHASWHRTYHRTMTQVASRDSVQADFNNVVLTNNNTRFTLFKKPEAPDEYWVRMQPLNDPTADPNAGVETRIGLITGSHHMQVFWVPEGHGNLQIGFPFTWLIPEKRWVPRNSTFVRPPDIEHRPEAWNIVCSRCHSTGLEPHFDTATRTVGTRVAELGISCEACHGPAQHHVDLRRSAPLTPNLTLNLNLSEIIHPEKLSAERSSQICGFCHSMKWIDKSSNWRATGFEYRPGDDLEKTTPIIRASSTNEIPGLADYLAKNPDLFRDFFWSDGMIRVSGREFNGLIESPCYKGGKFSCLSCHSGHDSDPVDMLPVRARSNAACLQCHEKFSEPRALAAHTRHAPNSSGSECYNCHMPHTTYGVLKAIRSHEISSPRIRDDLDTGRPNACNLCHLDRTLDWTAQQLKAWYNQQPPQLPEHGKSVSYAVRLALAGDAGQRAIIAWHLGWNTAQQTSGTNWFGPILGQLLDDPYAAVRLVAERSARTLNLLPANYDYTIPPDQRAPARELLWEKWKQSEANLTPDRQAQLLSWPADLDRQRRAFDDFLGTRDHRPVRLRE